MLGHLAQLSYSGFSVLTDDKNKFHLAMDLPSDGMIIVHLVYDYCGD